MPGGVRWSDEELRLCAQFFRTQMMPMTLYQRIIAINPARSYEAMMRKLREMRLKGWQKPVDRVRTHLRVGYLDIEATNLNADFGFILSWYIKARGKNHYDFAYVTRKEILSFQFDRRIIEELLEAFKNYDKLYAHYGGHSRFDLPFINSRVYHHKLEKKLPRYMEKFIEDTWVLARRKLKLHSNRLDSIARHLGIKHIKKTPLEPALWQRAAVGDEEAIEKICLHNKRDVQLLEAVHKKLEHIERPRFVSF